MLPHLHNMQTDSHSPHGLRHGSLTYTIPQLGDPVSNWCMPHDIFTDILITSQRHTLHVLHVCTAIDRHTSNVMTCSNLSPSQHFTTWSLPAENTKWVPGTNYNNNTDMITPPPSLLQTCTAITLSSWANIDLWQSPKSSPHNLMFLSADPVTSKVLSC